MHGVTDYPLSGFSIINIQLLIIFLISFKVAFNQTFLTYTGNMVTSVKLLGSEMKCDTSDPDYPDLGNELFNSFITALNNLCRTFTILFDDSSNHFHSLLVFLIWSRIFNISPLALMSGYI